MKKRMYLAAVLFYAIFMCGCLGRGGGDNETAVNNNGAADDLNGILINQSADAGSAVSNNAVYSEGLNGIVVSEVITLDTTAAPAPTFASATGAASMKAQAPIGLRPTSVTETAIQLIWTRGLNAATYNVYINSTLVKSGVVSTSVKIENLAPLTIYSIQVSSVAASGESALSSAVKVRTVLFPPKYLKPANVTATAFDLSWNAATAANSYNIYISGKLVKSGITANSAKFENLAPLTVYAIQTSSVAATGESLLTPVLQVRTVLLPPKNIKTAGVTDKTIELSWNAETGAAAYNVFVNSKLVKSGITANSVTIDSLRAATTYSIQVASTCAKGSSALSPAVGVKTNAAVVTPVAPVTPAYQKFRFIDNKNGTVTDLNTGLTWQKSPDTNGDGAIRSTDKMTWAQAQARPAALNAANYGGYSDWRLPNIKELYSIFKFAGIDPSGYAGTSTAGLVPYIDTNYFGFAYGETAAGERIIDSQYASSTLYVGKSMNNAGKLFGVNFADGRIKGYDLTLPGRGDKTFFVQCVRGNTGYEVNSFINNGDGTITDSSTGLMWSKTDSGTGMNWVGAASWVAAKNAANYLGHKDWRLADIKELQGIVDYTRSPDTSGSAAINPIFTTTSIKNEAGQADYPYFWSCTEHSPGSSDANYIAFGRALGYMNGKWQDVHGAGAQRSDPKYGSASSYPTGHGPQGDAIRINNFVRLVRTVTAK